MIWHTSRSLEDAIDDRYFADFATARHGDRAFGSLGSALQKAEIRARFDTLVGSDPLLRVDDLVAGYGARTVLRGVDLRAGAGQMVCLIGPGGAGKSTVLHSIFGLTDVRSGRIEVGGASMTAPSPSQSLRHGMAFCPEDRKAEGIFAELTVRENIIIGLQTKRGWLRRLSQAEQRRRRRIAAPSSDTRESITCVSSCRQNGQRMADQR